MTKEYDTFVDSLDELPEGKQVSLVVRDLGPGHRKYESSYVKAIVSSSPGQLPQADMLRVRFQRGTLHPKPFFIHILEVLGELKSSQPGTG